MLAAFENVTRAIHESWIADLRKITNESKTAADLSAAMLDSWAALEAPDHAEALGDALALSDLIGRAEVLAEMAEEDSGPELADPIFGTVDFKEMQDFMRQKISLPSNTWTDVLHQAHDRAFVVAGADSVALVEDLRGALHKAINQGGGLEGFRESFDEIIERTGWQYKGGRNWRTRVIYETNLRTAYQAGRLKQMRDPDVIKARPYWKYVHALIREPKQPREEHLAWNGKVFRHDDPIWETIYPPNDWFCSCGVVTLSEAGLRRLGKSAPDVAPRLKSRRVKDPTTGEMVTVPQGLGFGWGYQPGHTWEQGLVPRELQKPLSLLEPELPLPVVPSLDDIGRPFASPELPSGKEAEYYADRFLAKFGAAIDQAVMYRDHAGHAVLISESLFKNMDGAWKALKRDRAIHFERLAEAIFDPDEIWVDWGETQDGTLRLVRRYLRWDPELAAFGLFEWSEKGWSGVTIFDPRRGKANKPRRSYLESNRRGALIFRRK